MVSIFNIRAPRVQPVHRSRAGRKRLGRGRPALATAATSRCGFCVAVGAPIGSQDGRYFPILPALAAMKSCARCNIAAGNAFSAKPAKPPARIAVEPDRMMLEA
jgi:hypothetical protein